MTRRPALLAIVLVAAACDKSAAEAGGELFRDDHGLTESGLNRTSCSDCHESGPEEVTGGYHKAGYSLYGVAARESWWGGTEIHLLDAVNQCVTWFMRGDPLEPDDEAAHQLYEYLLSITPDDAPSDPLPMTIVENVTALPLGDAARGRALYDSDCAFCHGSMHSGSGNHDISDFVLPDDTADYDMYFPGIPHGLVVIEKIRHGRFFNVGGVMPFDSVERLSDSEISDILAALDLPAE